MTALILDWHRAYEAGLSICGGKGYHLAQLQRYGFPVPDGGVIVADVYRQLMQTPAMAALTQPLAALPAEAVMDAAAQEQLARVRQDIIATVLPTQVSTEIEDFMRQHHLDDRAVAVRSSAVSEDGPSASFAGMHLSVLNVRGVDAVCGAILQCFASLWRPQAVAYRRRMAFVDDDVLCAIVLCAMVTTPGGEEPQSAGVAFSCDPHRGRRDLIVINAARGSGERVVAGAVNPDSIEMRHVSGQFHLHSRNTSGAPTLTPDQEGELAHHVWRIHWALGEGDQPQDVEWAHDGHQLWILQARPVTRLPRYTFADITHLPVIWSTANIKDAVPGVVSMFAWSMIQEAIDGVLYAGPRLVGYEIPPGMQTVKRIDGHAYLDLTAIQWCWYDLIGVMPLQTVATIGGHQPEIPVPPGDPLSGPDGRRRQLARLKIFWRLLGFNRRFRRQLRQHMAGVRDIAALPWKRLSDAALLHAIGRLAELHQHLDPLVGFTNGYASVFKDFLAAQLSTIAEARAPGLMMRLLAGSGKVTSAEQGYRIADLARAAQNDPEALAWLQRRTPAQTWVGLPPDSPFRRALEYFLDDFGHRAVYEADVMNPRWRDDPGYILDQVRRMLETPVKNDPRLAARQVSAGAWEEVKRLTFWRRPVLTWLVKRVQRGFALRELGKSAMVASPEEGTRLGHGEILVAPSADPGWTPLFLRAGAVVMETGGYLSHGAIVAREYGLPAVVNIPGLLDHIKDGETLTVDGDAATVRRMT